MKFLQVSERGSEKMRIRGNFSYIPPIVSQGNQIQFEFYSDEDQVYKGFHASFTGIKRYSKLVDYWYKPQQGRIKYFARMTFTVSLSRHQQEKNIMEKTDRGALL